MENKPTKKQHYIPQFYLRQWVDNNGGFYPARIEEREPPKVTVFSSKSNPSRFCYENFFYAQHTGEEDEVSQLVEKGFAEIETVFSQKIPELEKKIVDNQQITANDKYHLSEFMIFLWIRGKKYREQSQEMSENMVKQVNKHIAHYSDKSPKTKAKMDELGLTKEDMIKFAEKGEYSVEFGNMHHLSLLKDMYGFCNILSAKYWKVYISRKGEFLTTDAPYQDRALSSTFYGNDYLSREQSFVLSPRVMIVAVYPKDDYGKKFSRKDITNDKGKLHMLNVHNLMNSIRFGFHKEKSLLEDVAGFATLVYEYKSKEQKTVKNKLG